MSVSKLLSAAALMLSAVVASPAAASIVYSQSGLTTYDSLTDFSTPQLSTNTVVTSQFAGLTFAATGNGAVRYNSCPNNWNGYNGLSGFVVNTFGPNCATNNTNDSFTLTFDSAVTAVSMGLYSYSAGNVTGRTWQTYLGNDLIETFTNNGSVQLIGYLTFSGYAFDRIRFTEGSNSGSFVVIDNIARVDAVPEPAALGLLGLGVLGLALRRRRKTA